MDRPDEMWARRIPKESSPSSASDEVTAEWMVIPPDAPVEAYVFPSEESATDHAREMMKSKQFILIQSKH